MDNATITPATVSTSQLVKTELVRTGVSLLATAGTLGVIYLGFKGINAFSVRKAQKRAAKEALATSED
jgi:hypothetical protein